jgi:hypothetical protein
MTKITTHKSGAWTTFEKLTPSGLYLVKLYSAAGNLIDKVRCDSYREAQAYLRCFNLTARNA